jgi:hypothetical protein
MAALPSKAEAGGVTDAEAPELIAQRCEPPPSLTAVHDLDRYAEIDEPCL